MSRWVVWGIIVVLLTAVPVEAGKKVALIIGNSAYANVPRLINPRHDAATVAEALRAVGFDTVDVGNDLRKTDMEAALQTFARTAKGADAAILYYAGHGIEFGNENYLVPVDASLTSPEDIRFEAVPLSLAQQSVKGAQLLKLVVLDACRNNPFAQRLPGEGRSLSRGLARLADDQLGGDMLVAFAAREGTTADDDSGYAKAFAAAVRVPGLDVPRVLGRIHDTVLEQTRHKQEPVVYGSYSAQQFFFVVAPVTVVLPQNADPKAIELTFWKSVADSEDVLQLQSYLDKYPYGEFVTLATAKIQNLKAHPRSPAKREQTQKEKIISDWLTKNPSGN